MGREGSEIYAKYGIRKPLFSAGGKADTKRRYAVGGVIHNTSKQRLWIAMRQPEGSLLGENPLIPLFSGAGSSGRYDKLHGESAP